MKKVIIKWTIGNTSKNGIDCLRLSMQMMKKLMPEATRFLCYNGEKENLPIDLADFEINQKEIQPLPCLAKGAAWKLYPPRIDLDAWEIWMDNDLVLYKIPPALQDMNSCFITESIKRSYCPELDPQIPLNTNYNTGLVGLPPKFDLKKELLKWVNSKTNWENHFEEQSIMAICLQKLFPKIIPLSEINVLLNENEYKEGSHGIHFCGLNGHNRHWQQFIMRRILC